jgi:hypothetical protein
MGDSSTADPAFEAEVAKLLAEEENSAKFDRCLERTSRLSTSGRIAMLILTIGIVESTGLEPLRAVARLQKAALANLCAGLDAFSEFAEALQAHVDGGDKALELLIASALED